MRPFSGSKWILSGLLMAGISIGPWAASGVKAGDPKHAAADSSTVTKSPAPAQADGDRGSGTADPCVKVEKGATVYPAEQNSDLRFIPVVPEKQQRFDSRDWEEKFKEPEPHKVGPSKYAVPESVSQGPMAPMPSPSLTFAGLGFSDSCTGGRCGAGWPPDTNGDVGPNHYIQAVNTAFGIYSKAGVLLASTTFNSLWSTANTGTPCDNLHDGDPVVIYDPMGDRWFVTDFAFPISGGSPAAPCYECIAVSKSPDPVSGGWYLYAINQTRPPSATFDLMNDYPKFGIWTDGLYQSANMFGISDGAYWGTAYWAYNRLDMEAGGGITPITASISGSSTFTMLPANLRIGPQQAFPPAGTPAYLVGDSQSAYAFDVRTFTVNWGAGTGSVSGATNVAYATPANDPRMPSQQDTARTLDTLSWRGMMQAQYKKVGTAESLWINHTVGTSTKSDAIQWSQINVTGGTIATTPVQTQIYAPDTTLDRWMGSLAVDGQGNMALGYSTSNSSNYPSLQYAGRLVGNTLNTLPQTETVLYAGTGSQSFTIGGKAVTRWGDYSAMTVDPTDDCTFWYTNEYYASTGSDWKTRVGSFRFPTLNCNNPSGTLVVTISDCSGATITNAIVTIDGHNYGLTPDDSHPPIPATGTFTAYLSPGIHSVNATYSGNTSSTSSPSISAGVTTNLSLTIGAIPSAPSTSGASRCGTGAVALTASGAASGQNYKWYTASTGGSPVQTNGSSYTTPSISGTTTYYVSIYNTITLCESSRASVVATINPVPTETGGGTGTGNILEWSSKTAIKWPTNASAGTYKLYRGQKATLPLLITSGTDACSKYTGTNTTTAISDDPSTLSTGDFYWYLVTTTSAAGCEGTAGNATGAIPRQITLSGTCPP